MCQLLYALSDAEVRHLSDEPQQYNNYEGFVFPDCPGPYEEYPVLKGKVYTGTTPPGPDRIIFQTFIGEVCGKCCVTHTNAPTPNGFLQCT
ncbi:hypothetical protein DICSQDRAFT_62737 [Dichomitus squalens LYAD-421 SS1]|uniref:Uncharacterized protein n=1 Tax=Dichomitus squalens (strain LYAD-421) TaxID=732165 RepID=R7SWP3_DICSQ|nr:uncharacterized protein DICSQDRAFT_62737 [Dichomitus squalens LYAD-421 SS1]EJF60501.1 hypothetical protein DICSQDRAFT_62737 [Dichomitus squalens LYAD-421 SS1]